MKVAGERNTLCGLQIQRGDCALRTAHDRPLAFAGPGFQKSLTALLWMSTIISVIFAIIRREFPLANALNHWDEAATHLAACCLLASISQIAAV
jgi:hypothetical protein